jgi:hypothetical protein
MTLSTVLRLASPWLLVTSCYCSTIVFNDAFEANSPNNEEPVSLSVDGQIITGDGGRISNFINGSPDSEKISFNISTNGMQFDDGAFFTVLREPDVEDRLGAISDVFVMRFTKDSPTYFVFFCSDPDTSQCESATVGGTDLTTVPGQGLPPNPYFENGQPQKVGTVFSTGDAYFIMSDVPEPGVMELVGFGLAVFALVTRRSCQTPRHNRQPLPPR